MEIVLSDQDLYEDAEKSNSNEENSIYKIECIGNGDIIDLHKHEYKVEVKSITYHEMEIKKNQCKCAIVIIKVQDLNIVA